MMWIILGTALLLTIPFGVAYAVFQTGFAAHRERLPEPHTLPTGSQYDPYAAQMHETVDKLLVRPCEEIWITARDGTRLFGRYYRLHGDEAPLTILFHGYKSNSIRDGSGGVELSDLYGNNVLLVDQRAHGKSGGKVITLGILERWDCLDWIEYANSRFGAEHNILLMGLSMGAATVLMAAGEGLPLNVRAIYADCGYASPLAIVEAVAQRVRVPARLGRWIGWLGMRLYGGVDLREASAQKALLNWDRPLALFHGTEDRFVPYTHSILNFNACPSEEKRLVLVEKAGHAMSYYGDRDSFLTVAEWIFRCSQRPWKDGQAAPDSQDGSHDM